MFAGCLATQVQHWSLSPQSCIAALVCIKALWQEMVAAEIKGRNVVNHKACHKRHNERCIEQFYCCANCVYVSDNCDMPCPWVPAFVRNSIQPVYFYTTVCVTAGSQF